jgi:hypothetical protein
MSLNDIKGTRSRAYLGNQARTPPNFIEVNRVPNENDSREYEIGALWLFKDFSMPVAPYAYTPRYFLLVSLRGDINKKLIADWREFDFASSGGADLERITGDNAVTVTGDPLNNFNIDMFGNPDLNFEGDAATHSFAVTNLTKPTAYVVGTDPLQARFTVIQNAINQAVADGATTANPQVVFIQPGTYTEDLTLAPGVFLAGHPRSKADISPVTIIGTCTAASNAVDTFLVCFIRFRQPAAANAFNISGTGAFFCSIKTCEIEAVTLGVDAVNHSAANANVSIYDSLIAADGAGATINHTAGILNIEGSDLLGTSGVDTAIGTVTSFRMVDSLAQVEITISGTNDGNIFFRNCELQFLGLVNTGGNSTNVFVEECKLIPVPPSIATNIAANCSALFNQCIVDSAAASWALGAGTISLNDVASIGTAVNIDPGLIRTGHTDIMNSVDLNSTENTASNQGQITVKNIRYFHTKGTNSTYIGTTAGSLTNTGSSNNVFGNTAGTGITTGSNNLFLGTSAGSAYTTESNNVAMYSAGVGGSSNQMWIGGAYGTGNFQTTDTYITGRIRRPETNLVSVASPGTANATGNAVIHKVLFNTVEVDQRGNFDAGNNDILIDKPGYYWMSAKTGVQNVGAGQTSFDSVISVNGAFAGRIATCNPLNASGTGGGFAQGIRFNGGRVQFLNNGDRVSVLVQVYGGAQTVTVVSSTLMIYLMA